MYSDKIFNAPSNVSDADRYACGAIPFWRVFSGLNVEAIKNNQGLLIGYHLDNTPNALASYFQFFDDIAANVVPGISIPRFSIGIPVNGAANIYFQDGIQFFKGISICQTTTPNGGIAPASNNSFVAFFR